jgi:hypothetical protein
MKTKSHHKNSFHQHVEQILRHRASLTIVLFLMLITVSSFDGRLRSLLQEVYAQGWGWMGTYMHHEHPMHYHGTLNYSRVPTISGRGF